MYSEITILNIHISESYGWLSKSSVIIRYSSLSKSAQIHGENKERAKDGYWHLFLLRVLQLIS
jgi:hypothetical protein